MSQHNATALKTLHAIRQQESLANAKVSAQQRWYSGAAW